MQDALLLLFLCCGNFKQVDVNMLAFHNAIQPYVKRFAGPNTYFSETAVHLNRELSAIF